MDTTFLDADFAVQIKGTASINGKGQIIQELPIRRGAMLAVDASQQSTGLKAYFGYAISYHPDTPTEAKIGIPDGAAFAGIAYATDKKLENEPAKPNYYLPGQNLSLCYFGPVWYKTWPTTAIGGTTQVAPAVGGKVICNNATGEVGFLGAATAVPTGATQINASILYVDSSTNGALVFIGVNNITLTALTRATKALRAFCFPFIGDVDGAVYHATINHTTKAVAVTVPTGTTVTALVPVFDHDGLSAKVGSTVQYSGETANDFTSPVVYRITAEDGTYTDYTVTVTIDS